MIAGQSASTEPPVGSWPLIDLKDAHGSSDTDDDDEEKEEEEEEEGEEEEEQFWFDLRPVGESGYRYLNKDTMQALFYFSEDTKRTPGSPHSVNLRGTGSLFRLFSTGEAREENMDAD